MRFAHWFSLLVCSCATQPPPPVAPVNGGQHAAASDPADGVPAEPERALVASSLDLAADGGPVEVSPTHFRVPRSFVEEIFNNLSGVADAEPATTEEGEPTGLLLTAIRPDSPLQRLGVRVGDELRAFSGHELTSPEAALEAYAELRHASSIDLDLVRAARSMRIHYEIVEGR